jgi:uncharacterized protein (DUF1800 family)
MKMRTIYLLLVCLTFNSYFIQGQETVWIGGTGIKPMQIIASDKTELFSNDGYELSEIPVMNGVGMTHQQNVMGRLIRQATMGLNEEQINETIQTNPEDWMANQMNIPALNFLDFFYETVDETRQYRLQYSEEDEEEIEFDSRISSEEFRIAYWRNIMDHDDHLRQKILYALSQIFVVSDQVGAIQDHGEGLASFTEILNKNAFGNFKNLLRDVTLEPIMGMFLSHLNNSREIPHLNIHPDENYAREIMQLFTIGLYELEITGEPKRDAEGELIPTYDQSDIQNLAKVFTGLGPGKTGLYADEDMPPRFGLGRFLTDFTHPMAMYEEYHDKTEKIIVGDFIIPANQTGMEDIDMALNHLFNHPNVGPFFCKQLIQKLVSSNPSPEYIKDIATIFNNNGQGVRGDLKSVIKGILLHPEARSCSSLQSTNHGKLQEPFIRYLEVIKHIDLQPNENGSIFYNGQNVFFTTTQNFLRAPTVFNFYKPNYSPFGPLRKLDLLGPEFQIHNSTTSLDLLNGFNRMTKTDFGMSYSWEIDGIPGYYQNNYDDFLPYAQDPESLVNHVDKIFTGGQMTTRTRSIIKQVLLNLEDSDGQLLHTRVQKGIYLALISPDFAVLK